MHLNINITGILHLEFIVYINMQDLYAIFFN